VGKESSSKCECERLRKGAMREITSKWDRLSLHCNPLKGHYPRTRDLILYQ
jgi:hypothetical protein